MTLWNSKSFQSCQGKQIHGPRFGLSVFEMLTVSRVKFSWQALGHGNKCGRRPGADGTMKRRQCQVRLSLVIPCDTWPDSVNLEPKSLIKANGYSREVKRHVFEWPEALLVLPKRNLNGFRWVNWPMAILQQPHWAATGMTLKLGSLAEQWHAIISPYNWATQLHRQFHRFTELAYFQIFNGMVIRL
jgi:hypothetical protein